MEQRRKGARSFNDLDPHILNQLNRGEIESANLTEWLAVDQQFLLQFFLRQVGREHYFEPIIFEITKLDKQSSNTLIQTIGYNLLLLIDKNSDFELQKLMSTHTSDVIRCWTTFIIAYDDKLSLCDKLTQIKNFASDSHFGVREEAWMAIRPTITENLIDCIKILTTWTKSEDEYIRRFTTESTRPRGVWCKHIEVLKEKPQLAIEILESLKSDPSKYVRDSVANWLNDASKTQPKFVENLCNKWSIESATKDTNYIIKKALRSLNKTQN